MTNQDGAKPNTPGLLRVLVYGTLKRGMWNHERFCAGALSIEEAVVCGRLYEMDCGLPVLQVPGADILAHGSADPCADVAAQTRFEAGSAQHPDQGTKGRTRRGWGLVRGELMTFDDPEERLPRLDRLEGYRPGSPSLYNRVLVSVFSDGAPAAAWAYVGGEDFDKMPLRLLCVPSWSAGRPS
ncbi:MAG TPA: gamma-glutamylcyclotransferase [Candidatus Hydrogenedentes bacterium]|nr:gamma-glutamylcyclotransferase [Candidatus Hydrogenedentota bacterium]